MYASIYDIKILKGDHDGTSSPASCQHPQPVGVWIVSWGTPAG